MASHSPELTNIATLIAPIANSHHGVGEDLTFDLRIEAIVAARHEDDPLLAQGNWITELKVADWDLVKTQCADLLIHTSKDLKIALWYIDALSHTDHLAGISHGLALLKALNDDYWLTMYPPLDGEEETMDIRAGLLSWFVKALSDDLKQLALSDNKTEHYNYNYYLTARDHDKQRQQNPDNESVNQLILSDYNQAIKGSSESWQRALITNLDTISKQWQTLTEQLNHLMDMDAPVFAPVTDLLVSINNHLQSLLPKSSQLSEITAANLLATNEHSSAALFNDNQQSNTANTEIGFNPESLNYSSNQQGNHQHNRRQALKTMAQIQQYFAENEPHSPVTFLLGRAIDWADMPLDQWLSHIIKNEDQLAILSDMIGIQPKSESTDDANY